MLVQPIDIFVYAWLTISVMSAAYVAWDQLRGNPEAAVMKWGFVLITLYTGPIGLLLYVMADKEPRPGEHEAFVAPLWKQGVGSTVHCLAGDATGIILAAVVVTWIGLPMWLDLIIEYAAGFLFGLFIFQALFMRAAMGGTYLENLRRSFLPELISMNCMMAAMAPVMVVLMMGRDMRGMWPGEALFWMVMSLGVIAGFAIAYPVNVWMVAKGLKHGLMTARGKPREPANGHTHAKSHAHAHAGELRTPLHPAIVHFPLALLVLAVAGDGIAFVGGIQSLATTARWALSAAAVGAALAVLAGLHDMHRATMSEEAHHRVHRHMYVGLTLAGVIVGLTAWRWLAGVSALYLSAAVVSLGLAALQGWLGGELVFRDGVGVARRRGTAHQQEHGHEHGSDGGHEKPHGGHEKAHGQHEMKAPDVTGPQLAALTVFTVVLLLAGTTVPSAFFNLRPSAHDVRGVIMPPGMIMTRETSAEAMREMAAVDPHLVTHRYSLEDRGDRPLEPRLENGVKVFELEPSVIQWQILPDVHVDAYAYNGQIPGPRIQIRQGDRVRLDVINHLPETTSVHWHGLVLPNVMDGAARVTQEPIEKGSVYHYEFTATQAGTFFYHSHDHPDRQQALGLYGALIIDPAVPDPALAADHEYTVQLQEWLVRDGRTFPAMPMEGAMPNYFTINGKAYPATDTIEMKVGETLRVRFIGSNTGFIHPMHIHGGPFVVVARDGITLPLAQRFSADTIEIGPGQRYDVIWTAEKAGMWMLHCHISHHTTNNNVETQGGGGLMVHIHVEGDPTQ